MASEADLRRLRRIRVKEGGLHGWRVHASEESRHEALNRTLHSVGYKTTVERLNLERTRLKHHPEDHRRATEDLRWLQEKHEREE